MTRNLSKAVLVLMACLLVSFLAVAQDGEQQGGAQEACHDVLRDQRRDRRRR